MKKQQVDGFMLAILQVDEQTNKKKYSYTHTNTFYYKI